MKYISILIFFLFFNQVCLFSQNPINCPSNVDWSSINSNTATKHFDNLPGVATVQYKATDLRPDFKVYIDWSTLTVSGNTTISESAFKKFLEYEILKSFNSYSINGIFTVTFYSKKQCYKEVRFYVEVNSNTELNCCNNPTLANDIVIGKDNKSYHTYKRKVPCNDDFKCCKKVYSCSGNYMIDPNSGDKYYLMNINNFTISVVSDCGGINNLDCDEKPAPCTAGNCD